MFAWDAHVFKREASPALPRALAKRVLSAFRLPLLLFRPQNGTFSAASQADLEEKSF
jgi:hypothetical protein